MNSNALLFVCSILIVGVFNIIEFDKIEWISWEQAQLEENKEQKKYFVWIYDENCQTCLDNEKNIFTQANIQYLKEHYIPISLKAHEKNTIKTKGTVYQNLGEQNHDLHELAIALTHASEQISFPKIVFLDENMDLIAPIDGNLAAAELHNYLSFVKDDFFFEMDINTYEEGLVTR